MIYALVVVRTQRVEHWIANRTGFFFHSFDKLSTCYMSCKKISVIDVLIQPALITSGINESAATIVNADHKILLLTLSSPRSPCSEKP